MPDTPSLETRLDRVEQVITALSREVAAIRAELVRTGAAPAASQAEVKHPSVAAPVGWEPNDATFGQRVTDRVRSLDLEGLFGRYGILAIAVFAAVAAVGTFLSWAISRGYLTLGPAARVILGLVFAAGIGAWGLRLRRTERSFGSSLIGLALVIVLVCAWAAGPTFALVPTPVAFLGAAAVAWGLALFARSQDDEPLWCVAFGGAALAPFATSDGTGSLYALLGYSFVLLVFGCFGVGRRAWPIAWRVFYLAAALLSVALDWLAPTRGVWGLAAVLALPMAVGLAGVIPFAPDSHKRAALRWLAVLTVLASFAIGRVRLVDASPAWLPGHAWVVGGAILVLEVLWLAIVDGAADVVQSSLLARNTGRATMLHWFDAALLPAAFAYRAADVLAQGAQAEFSYVISVAAIAVFVWRRPAGDARDAAAGALMAIALPLALDLPPGSAFSRVLFLGALGLLALVLHRLRPSRSWIPGGAVVFVLAALVNTGALLAQPHYTQPPFMTRMSLAALCLTAALAVVARFWRWLFEGACAAMTGRPRRGYADRLIRVLKGAVAAPWVWAFVWVLVELSIAYSRSMSTLLLVVYFAATGVASVAVGRRRRSARLRQIGLALAVVAAATAVYGASTYFNSGFRILAYLVTSAFLLGIAYWYRRTGPVAAQT